MLKKQTYFEENKIINPEFSKWLVKGNNLAKYEICRKAFALSHMSERVLSSHTSGNWDKKKIKSYLCFSQSKIQKTDLLVMESVNNIELFRAKVM